MKTQHGLKGFKFQTDNKEYKSKVRKDQVAHSGGLLITVCTYLRETTTFTERSWRTMGDMVGGMLLHSGLVENCCADAT